MRIFSLPLALPIIWLADHLQNKNSWLNDRPKYIASIDSLIGISLWFAPGGIIFITGMLFASWL